MSLIEKFRMDKSVVQIHKKDLEPSSRSYWMSQSPQKRIEAIEFLRQQVHGTQSRLQRVYRIIKLK